MMNVYNMLNGVNPATFFVLPLLGEKHPVDYPRFRDCFSVVDGKDREIHVLTRVGGSNRNQGYGEEELQKHPNFLRDYDEEEDSTFATYVFSVPKEWEKDFSKIIEGKLSETSDKYQERVKKVYPKLKDKLDELFRKEDPRLRENVEKQNSSDRNAN